MKTNNNWSGNTGHKKEKFYVVFKGRKPGIYFTWFDCEKQIHKFPNSIFKAFFTYVEAEDQFHKFIEMLPPEEPEKVTRKAKVLFWFPGDDGYQAPTSKENEGTEKENINDSEKENNDTEKENDNDKKSDNENN
jgi:ribonuclease HI